MMTVHATREKLSYNNVIESAVKLSGRIVEQRIDQVSWNTVCLRENININTAASCVSFSTESYFSIVEKFLKFEESMKIC